MLITDLLNNPIGSLLISALLGFGLAAVFKKVCNDGHCLIVKGPPFEEIDGKTFIFEDKCYQYKPKAVECPRKNKKTSTTDTKNNTQPEK